MSNNRLPHECVFTRLAPSLIHGIGVFAILKIPKGTMIFCGDDAELGWISKKEVDHIATPLRKLYEDFCILKNDQYGCPDNFNKLTPSWYINHSASPNVYCDEYFNFIAIRDIQPGEELTSNYFLYSDENKNIGEPNIE